MISHVNTNARSDLILPLRREDLSVDPRDVDSRGEAELVVDLLDVAGDGDSGTSRAVVGALGGRESSLGPSKGPLGLGVEEGVLLLDSEPRLVLGSLLHGLGAGGASVGGDGLDGGD